MKPRRYMSPGLAEESAILMIALIVALAVWKVLDIVLPILAWAFVWVTGQ